MLFIGFSAHFAALLAKTKLQLHDKIVSNGGSIHNPLKMVCKLEYVHLNPGSL